MYDVRHVRIGTGLFTLGEHLFAPEQGGARYTRHTGVLRSSRQHINFRLELEEIGFSYH